MTASETRERRRGSACKRNSTPVSIPRASADCPNGAPRVAGALVGGRPLGGATGCCRGNACVDLCPWRKRLQTQGAYLVSWAYITTTREEESPWPAPEPRSVSTAGSITGRGPRGGRRRLRRADRTCAFNYEAHASEFRPARPHRGGGQAFPHRTPTSTWPDELKNTEQGQPLRHLSASRTSTQSCRPVLDVTRIHRCQLQVKIHGLGEPPTPCVTRPALAGDGPPQSDCASASTRNAARSTSSSDAIRMYHRARKIEADARGETTVGGCQTDHDGRLSAGQPSPSSCRRQMLLDLVRLDVTRDGPVGIPPCAGFHPTFPSAPGTRQSWPGSRTEAAPERRGTCNPSAGSSDGRTIARSFWEPALVPPSGIVLGLREPPAAGPLRILCETPGAGGLAQSSILLVNTHSPWIADWMPAPEDRRHAER